MVMSKLRFMRSKIYKRSSTKSSVTFAHTTNNFNVGYYTFSLKTESNGKQKVGLNFKNGFYCGYANNFENTKTFDTVCHIYTSGGCIAKLISGNKIEVLNWEGLWNLIYSRERIEPCNLTGEFICGFPFTEIRRRCYLN